MISISNSIYLSLTDSLGKRPIIGWHSVVTTTGLSASSEDTDYPILNAWNPDTASFWRSDAVPTSGIIYIYINNPDDIPIDYLGIARHNFGSTGCAYTLQDSLNSVDWTDVVSSKTPTTDRAIVEYFDASTEPFWRLKLEPNGATPPELAHIKLGTALILQRPIYVGHRPATLGLVSSRSTDLGDSGQYIGQVVTRRWHQTDCIQKNTYPDWVRNYLTPFIDHTQLNREDDDTAQGAFFFAWRPTDYPLEVIYGWTEDNIMPRNQLPNGRMEYEFRIQGVV